ncbi:MAG: type II toxin-antitoxin system RelE/ParE family toxin [Thermoleophilia bacterium]|nr:type II toxin-antitoxin system RelE/ParE family toxin [Thermoleophilia bacterium]
MTLRVRLTPPARAQFLAALAYIRGDRPSAAAVFRERVNDALARLVDFPDSGRVVPEFPDLEFREVIVAPYRFFYRVEAGTVWVVAAWHAAQIPETPEDAGAG